MFTTITAAVAWLAANYVNIVAIIGGLVTTASVIVKITKTRKDDEWLGKALRVLEAFSLAKRKPAVVKADVDATAVDEIMAALEEAYPGASSAGKLDAVSAQLRGTARLDERL